MFGTCFQDIAPWVPAFLGTTALDAKEVQYFATGKWIVLKGKYPRFWFYQVHLRNPLDGFVVGGISRQVG